MNEGEAAENLRRGTIGKGFFLGREEWFLARDSYGSLRPASYAYHLPSCPEWGITLATPSRVLKNSADEVFSECHAELVEA